ncbi:MAG: single-stranded DNA-binding protein [Bacteroidales bacterium]|nr:single-stranded DNA-binding protein [Bacteroidales bacterium]
MLGINKIILMGTVGRNPDTRYIDKGVSYSRFSVCTEDVVTSVDGRLIEETEWHEVVVWRQLSDYVSRYVKKGDLVSVEGKLKSRYVSRGEGGHRVYEVIASGVKILARSKANAEAPIENPSDSDADNAQTVGSALPNFDIENIPGDFKGDGDQLPF